MKKVIKVMMFVWRDNNGKREFFVVHSPKHNVIPTGHVGDIIKDETLKDAVKREVLEELGVYPLEIIDLKYSVTVILHEMKNISTEHAFLVEIPNQEVKFLERDEPHKWHPFAELESVLTHDGQKCVTKRIKKYFANIL